MTSDVEVTVSGLPFNQRAISGIEISYGVNQIPVASLHLVAPYIEQNHRDFLCDPDKYKKQTRDNPVTFQIKARTGCLKFTGVFDGISFSQMPGGFSYSAIFKSQFQSMMELYPKFMGLDPLSMMPFKRIATLKTQVGAIDEPYESLKYTLNNRVTASNDTVITYYMRLIKEMINSQINATLASNTTQELSDILALLQDQRYKRNAEKCQSLLEDIDTSFAEDTDMRAGKCMPYLIDKVVYSQDTLWDTILAALDDFGCMLLPANDKLFIAPKVNYLKMADMTVPAKQEQATKPNHIYPSDVTSVNVNDVPYRNLRGCFVVPIVSDPGPLGYSFATQCLGAYPKPQDTDVKDDGGSGLLIINAPTFLIQNVDGLYVKNNDVQTDIQVEAKAYAGDQAVETPDEPQQKYKQLSKDVSESLNVMKEILDKYAKARFLSEKYSERGGSIQTAVFKPNFVPGTTGFWYTRHPGLFYNFFVTSVTHSITLGGGKVGNATSHISFNSLRYGGSPDNIPGVDEAELYNFSSDDMADLQQQWLDNIEGKAELRKID